MDTDNTSVGRISMQLAQLILISSLFPLPPFPFPRRHRITSLWPEKRMLGSTP
jgi:hypothetical protein